MAAADAAAACKATCVLLSASGSTTILGTLTLTQQRIDSPVAIQGTVSGLTPNAKHGWSVCVSGDLSQGASSCGPIFNPFGKSHGAPGEENSMMGDLGNLQSDEKGSCAVQVEMPLSLVGPHSVLGRSIVIYAGQDDQGRGGYEHSLVNGNPGPRLAAGVIGLSCS